MISNTNGDVNGYCPRFSGLMSSSYDDLFEYSRDNPHMTNILHLNYDFFHTVQDFCDPLSAHSVPLMATTPDSTLTTHMDSDAAQPEPGDASTSSESRPFVNAGGGAKQLAMRRDGRLTFTSTVS